MEREGEVRRGNAGCEGHRTGGRERHRDDRHHHERGQDQTDQRREQDHRQTPHPLFSPPPRAAPFGIAESLQRRADRSARLHRRDQGRHQRPQLRSEPVRKAGQLVAQSAAPIEAVDRAAQRRPHRTSGRHSDRDDGGVQRMPGADREDEQVDHPGQVTFELAPPHTLGAPGAPHDGPGAPTGPTIRRTTDVALAGGRVVALQLRDPPRPWPPRCGPGQDRSRRCHTEQQRAHATAPRTSFDMTRHAVASSTAPIARQTLPAVVMNRVCATAGSRRQKVPAPSTGSATSTPADDLA